MRGAEVLTPSGRQCAAGVKGGQWFVVCGSWQTAKALAIMIRIIQGKEQQNYVLTTQLTVLACEHEQNITLVLPGTL